MKIFAPAFLIVLIFFCACKKPKPAAPVPVSSTSHWLTDSSFVLDAKYIQNASSDRYHVYFLGDYDYNTVDTNGVPSFSLMPWGNFLQRTAMSPQFTLYTDNSAYGECGVWNNQMHYNVTDFALKDIDSSFSGLPNLSDPQLVAWGAFNTSVSQLLLEGTRSSDSACTFYLIRLLSFGCIPQKLTLHEAPYTVQNAVYSFSGNYYIGTDQGEIYRMDTGGNYQRVVANAGGGVNGMFEFKGKIYANTDNAIFASQDSSGLQWSAAYQVSGIFRIFDFYTINNRLVYTYEDQVYELVFSASGFTSHQLVNQGLAGNIVTSIQPLGKKVYAATLSGLFYTPLDSFFIYQ